MLSLQQNRADRSPLRLVPYRWVLRRVQESQMIEQVIVGTISYLIGHWIGYRRGAQFDGRDDG